MLYRLIELFYSVLCAQYALCTGVLSDSAIFIDTVLAGIAALVVQMQA